VHPTGGGTVFRNGNYISGQIKVGNTNLVTTSVVDSFNSTVAAYNSLSPGTNASFGSGSTSAGALTVYYPSPFRGSYTAAPTAVLSSVISLLGLAPGPSSTSLATEGRTPGNVIFPNVSGLGADKGALPRTGGGTGSVDTPGVYDDFTITNTLVTVTNSGTYSVSNLYINTSSSSILSIPDGKTVNLIVRGNMTISTGKIQLNSTGVLNIYAMNNVTITNGQVNNNGGTSRLTVFGATTGGSITITNASTMYGSIYAPQHTVTLQSSSPKMYGAIIAQSLTIKDSAQFHFDEALRSMRISNLTGGSAAPGSADYSINIIGGTGVIK